ncbi:hypothetical protein NDU88_005226 [Pleurodeles waltl]|uniref:Uncharacterized protein n=1 Tax=Pleurodeles waltl TaxID=8319 RepID=A0AAV7L8V8_PLEWA|nr:hypothetical protein NDU88_005226 [Pleurodeles waltl]
MSQRYDDKTAAVRLQAWPSGLGRGVPVRQQSSSYAPSGKTRATPVIGIGQYRLRENIAALKADAVPYLMDVKRDLAEVGQRVDFLHKAKE